MIEEIDKSKKKSLFELLANVLLIPDSDRPGCYHVRSNMTYTTSWIELQEPSRLRMKELYEYFIFQRQNNLWLSKANAKFDFLSNINETLICAEDLDQKSEQIIQNIKNYNLGLHLKLDGMKFVWHDNPIQIHSLPSGIKSAREACEYVDSIQFDYSDTFSVIAANDKTVAVSVCHMVCDGGFFRSIYSKLLDQNYYEIKPQTPIVVTDFFQKEQLYR